MALHFSVNNAYTVAQMGPYPLFDWKTLMVAHGWTVTRSNDGTLFGAADYITTALKLTNRYSWMVLQSADGAGGREWLLGMSNNVGLNEWYVGYSASTGFTGGDTTTMPTATDEVAVLQDRDQDPYDLFPDTNDCYCHMMVDDASDAFYLITADQTNGNMVACLAGDPVTQAHASDADPYVAIAQHYNYYTNITGTTSPWGYYSTTSNFTRSWYNYPSGSAERVWAAHLTIGTTTDFAPADATQGGGVNPYDGNDDTFPVIWGRCPTHGIPYGMKGMSTLFRNVSTTGRSPGDLLAVGADKQIMTGTVYGFNVSLPWDPAIIPL